MNDSVKTLLEQGRDRVARGWTQGALSSTDNNGTTYCARGAIVCDNVLLIVPGVKRQAEMLLARIIREQYPEYVCTRPGWCNGHNYDASDDKHERSIGTIVCWNNAPERTQDEVVAIFEKAIAEAAFTV